MTRPTLRFLQEHVHLQQPPSPAFIRPPIIELFQKRKSPLHRETLYRQKSEDLLHILAGYVGRSTKSSKVRRRHAVRPKPRLFYPGHHQVYFNLVFAEKHLLEDGADKLHWPGEPFYQRLWAGGSLTFNTDRNLQLYTEHVAVLQEDIEDVKFRGDGPDRKVFVTISRKIATSRAPTMAHIIDGDMSDIPDLGTLTGTNLNERILGELAMEEKKVLVFVQHKTEEQRQEILNSTPKVIKPIIEPDYSVTITPTSHLLSRFSFLTFNAHRIHLDREYCRTVEGHRDLLVHGPLTQVLMLTVLNSQLNKSGAEEEMIVQFDYKNLAPLYVNEEMRICVTKDPRKPAKYAVWIEGKDGGYAAKATAVIGKRQAEAPELRRSDLEVSPEIPEDEYRLPDELERDQPERKDLGLDEVMPSSPDSLISDSTDLGSEEGSDKDDSQDNTTSLFEPFPMEKPLPLERYTRRFNPQIKLKPESVNKLLALTGPTSKPNPKPEPKSKPELEVPWSPLLDSERKSIKAELEPKTRAIADEITESELEKKLGSSPRRRKSKAPKPSREKQDGDLW